MTKESEKGREASDIGHENAKANAMVEKNAETLAMMLGICNIKWTVSFPLAVDMLTSCERGPFQR